MCKSSLFLWAVSVCYILCIYIVCLVLLSLSVSPCCQPGNKGIWVIVGEWCMLMKYDDGAFKLFMIEATASYHLWFIFHSSLSERVCMCFLCLSALKSFSFLQSDLFPQQFFIDSIFFILLLILNQKHVEHVTCNLLFQSIIVNWPWLQIKLFHFPLLPCDVRRTGSYFWYCRVKHTEEKIKGQKDIWKDRRKVAIVYFVKPQTPDGCQHFKCDDAL